MRNVGSVVKISNFSALSRCGVSELIPTPKVLAPWPILLSNLFSHLSMPYLMVYARRYCHSQGECFLIRLMLYGGYEWIHDLSSKLVRDLIRPNTDARRIRPTSNTRPICFRHSRISVIALSLIDLSDPYFSSTIAWCMHCISYSFLQLSSAHTQFHHPLTHLDLPKWSMVWTISSQGTCLFCIVYSEYPRIGHDRLPRGTAINRDPPIEHLLLVALPKHDKRSQKYRCSVVSCAL